MILVGSQRGGYRDLANHLMKDENERVDVHELRGFAGQDLHEAFQESYAISKATHCRQHLFSLSLNPPRDAQVSIEQFRAAIERSEDQLGLKGQPRAIVFHEKRGDDGEIRRHAHAVWCRIDTDQMKAIPLSYHKNKLQEVARGLYVEHGWRMPAGFLNKEDRDPRNFSLEEWQQCKRAGRDPKALKSLMQDAWSLSDSRASFAAAIRERGLVLAKGDRRGFVAVDHAGEVYAVARLVGVRTKAVRDKLGEPEGLPSVEKAHALAVGVLRPRLEELRRDEIKKRQEAKRQAQKRAETLKTKQTRETDTLKSHQQDRRSRLEAHHQACQRKGLAWLWDWLRGAEQQRQAQQEQDKKALAVKERSETKRMEGAQERQREEQQRQSRADQARHKEQAAELREDVRALRAVSARAGPPAQGTPAKEQRSESQGLAGAPSCRDEARKAFKEQRRADAQERSHSRRDDGPMRER